ncbi:MAG: GNAT family N-acetyltransferase [Actinobacteria bacterium]|nr:GNAT family N-acetyltransferase [Actinomycetota bacterium]
MFHVRTAQIDDVDQWLRISREVEPLFGPMPDIRQHVERGIARGTALVATEADALLGACLLSRDDAPHAIHWLAVARVHRRRGVGSLLIDAVRARWSAGDISVVTFATDTPEGEAARRLCESHGFRSAGPAPAAEDGSARCRYVLGADPLRGNAPTR